MRSSARQYFHAGFTIVELLIVATIISILAGILIPRLASARAKAISTSAGAYARQCVTAATRVAMEQPVINLSGLTCQENDGDSLSSGPLPDYVLSAVVSSDNLFVEYIFSANGHPSETQRIPLNISGS